MNLKSNQKGFTIVELLIVIIVIAILAAISIAAYTNIQNRARTSAAAAAAKSVKDVAEAYNGANSGYPTSKAQFVSGGTDSIAKLPSDVTFGADLAAIAADNTGKTVLVERSPQTGTITGFRITYRDFQAGTNVVVTTGDLTPTTPTFAVLSNT